MSFFSGLSGMFSSSKSNYAFNTLESLKVMDPTSIVSRFQEINPNIWENSSYNDSNAIDVLGKDRFRALMFGIRHSNKPPEKRVELWERQEEEKGMKKSLNSAPSTRNLPTPGWRDQDQELADRIARLKQGGRRTTRGKSKKMKGKSIRRKSIRRKSIGGRKSIRRKSIRRKVRV